MFKARFDTFHHALFGKVDGTDFARQAHLAKDGGVFVDRHVVRRARKRRANGKVGGWLVQFNAAHCVDIHVGSIKGDSAPFFQNGNEHDQLVIIDAEAHSSGHAVGGFGNKRLNFHVHAPIAAFGRRNCRACRHTARFGKENLGVIVHALNAAVRHLEHAHLLCRAKAVFDGAEQLEIILGLSLEIEDGVHDMFQNLWPCKRAFLGDVADNEKGDIAGFSNPHKLCGALAHLPNRACRRGQRFRIDGLNRVNHHKAAFAKRTLNVL